MGIDKAIAGQTVRMSIIYAVLIAAFALAERN